jgi:membrane protease YdiL (CAAX protease family)
MSFYSYLTGQIVFKVLFLIAWMIFAKELSTYAKPKKERIAVINTIAIIFVWYSGCFLVPAFLLINKQIYTYIIARGVSYFLFIFLLFYTAHLWKIKRFARCSFKKNALFRGLPLGIHLGISLFFLKLLMARLITLRWPLAVPTIYYFQIADMLFLAPFLEEFLFRGCFQFSMEKYFSKWMAIILCSILFGLGHLTDFTGFVIIVLSAIFYGWAFTVTRSILTPILIHFFDNLFSSLFRFTKGTFPLRLDWWVIGVMGGIWILYLFLYYKKKIAVSQAKQIE